MLRPGTDEVAARSAESDYDAECWKGGRCGESVGDGGSRVGDYSLQGEQCDVGWSIPCSSAFALLLEFGAMAGNEVYEVRSN